MKEMHDGDFGGLAGLFLLSDAKTRSISAENFSGEKGRGGMAAEGTGAEAARELGRGWKVSPCIHVEAGATAVLAEIAGPGVIEHIWMTCDPAVWRSLIVRFYWDGEAEPSAEVPLGDFFCNGWCERSNVNSLPVAVNPAGGMNSYWPMPFCKAARVTLENQSAGNVTFFYQVTYSLTPVPGNAAYFHAAFRRSTPPEGSVHTILDGVRGKGQYVGTYLAYQPASNGWWGEGEVKFYLDGDNEFPTICGTGTEDYFGGAGDWEQPAGQYCTYSTPFLGMHQLIPSDHLYRCQQRFGMYRWHVMDCIRFDEDIRVTIQCLGWRSGGRYLPLTGDIATVAYWYQTEPHAKLHPLPDRNGLEVI